MEEEEKTINGKRQSRRSRDEIINKKEKILIERIEEKGWMIINGSKGEEGDWTYIGGNSFSIIDYAITNEKTIEKVER